MADHQISIKIGGQLDASLQAACNAAKATLSALGQGAMAGTRLAGKALLGMGAAAAAIGVGAVKSGMEFESAMASVAAVSGASAEEYNRLEEAARAMGRATTKTATESAQALEYMALAGWSVDESIAGLPQILHLSEASGMDLAQTSDMVTDTMSALSLTVEELPRYLDLVAMANNRSNTSAQQLMEAYLGVGGVLNGLGVPLAESGAALGVLANRGLKGSEAGTALNAILTNLTTGAGQAGSMMEQLGLSAFDDEGKFIGLTATLQRVSDALADLDDQSRNAALAALGGKSHVDALNNLLAGLNNETEEGVTEWAALTSELENSSGALERMRDVKLDTLAGNFETLKSAVSDVGLTIYESMQSPLRSVTQSATSLVGGFGAALASGGFGSAASSIGPVIGSISSQISGQASALIGSGFQVVGNLLLGIQQAAPQIGSGAAVVVSSFVEGFMGYVSQFWVTAAALIDGFVGALAANAQSLVSAGAAAVTSLMQGLAMHLPGIINSGMLLIVGLISGIAQALPSVLAAAASTAVVLVTSLADAISNHGPDLIASAGQLIGNLIVGLVKAIPELLAAVGKLAVAIIDALMETDWLQVGADIVKKIGEGLSHIFDFFGQGAASQALSDKALMDAGFMGDQFNAAEGFGTNYVRSVIRGLDSRANEARLAGSRTMESYYAGAQSSGDQASGAGAQTADRFAAAIMANASTLGIAGEQTGDAAGRGLAESINQGAGEVDLSSYLTLFEDLMSDTTTTVQAGADETLSALTSAMTEGETTVSTGMANTTTAVQTGMANTTTAVQTGMSSLVASMQAGFSRASGLAASTASSIAGAFAGINLYSIGANIGAGLAQGMESSLARVQAAARNLANAARDATAAAAAVRSPSRVFERLGVFMGQGLSGGMESTTQTVEHSGFRLAQAAVASAEAPVRSGVARLSTDGIEQALRGLRREQPARDYSAGLEGLRWRQPGPTTTAADPGYTITYAPQYHFEAGAPTRSDLESASSRAQADFDRWMQQYQRTRARRAY